MRIVLNYYCKYLLIFLFISTFPAFASKPMPEEAVEMFCQAAKNQSLHILLDLEIKFINYPDRKRIESYREVLAEGLISERKKLESKLKKDKSYSNLLSLFLLSAEEKYKYALCEKFYRQDAKPIIIAEEAYMACRIELTTNQKAKKGDCF